MGGKAKIGVVVLGGDVDRVLAASDVRAKAVAVDCQGFRNWIARSGFRLGIKCCPDDRDELWRWSMREGRRLFCA